MNPSSEDIKDILESSSCAIATFGEDMFIGSMPDSPDDCICLYDSAGEPMERGVETPHLMIHIRKSPGQYLSAYNMGIELRDQLHGFGGITINNTWYIGIWLLSGPLFLGCDQKKRPMFSINFRIQRSAS